MPCTTPCTTRGLGRQKADTHHSDDRVVGMYTVMTLFGSSHVGHAPKEETQSAQYLCVQDMYHVLRVTRWQMSQNCGIYRLFLSSERTAIQRRAVCGPAEFFLQGIVRAHASADVRLSVCPSVRLSVCPSVRLSVCPSAGRCSPKTRGSTSLAPVSSRNERT